MPKPNRELAFNPDGSPAVATSKHKDIASLMKDDDARMVISNAVDEAVKVKAAIATLKTQEKAIRDALLQKVDIKPAMFNAWVAVAFNNDHMDRKHKLDEHITLLDFIMGEQGIKLAAPAKN
jgi:sulfur carrier protein ThiS